MSKGTKLGRPRDPERAKIKALMCAGGMSDRTFARFWRATQLRNDYGLPDALMKKALKEARRPNGGVNTSRVLRFVEAACIAHAVDDERKAKR